MKNEEQTWLEHARAGDPGAFGRLVQAYQRPVYNLAYRMLGNPEEAEDAAQETFLRAYSRLHQYNPKHKFSTWVFSIANHHCIDRLRRRRLTTVPMDETPLVFALESDADQPEDKLLAEERAQEVQALIDQLAPQYRTPVILRYWHGYSYQEIAEIMEISLAAVKSRLFRARQKLAEVYQQSQQTTTQVRAPAGQDGQAANEDWQEEPMASPLHAASAWAQ